MSKIIVEDLTEPKENIGLDVEIFSYDIYMNAIYSGLKLKFKPRDILKALLIASNGAEQYMQTVDLISSEEMEKINSEVDAVIKKQNETLKSTGIIDAIKKAAKRMEDE